MVKVLKIVLAILLGATMGCLAQHDSFATSYTLSGKVGYNSIWTGRESLQSFTQDHPWSVQLDFGVIKNTQKAWNYCNCYAENGLTMSYINFGDPKRTGNAITFAAFAEPYLLLKRQFHLSLRASAGLAFLNKVYDSISNKDAIFFSTKTSFILGLGFNFSWRLSNNWRVTSAVQFNHISNGGKKDPNEGMNFPGVNVGLTYIVNPPSLEIRAREKTTKSTHVVVHGFGGIRTAWADANWPEEKRLLLGANVGVIRRLGKIVGVGAGGEYYYDGVNEVYGQRAGQQVQNGVGGLSAQAYIFFGKLLFGQQLAWYVTPNTGYQKNFYQRYILEYEVKKNWYAGVTLKAHGDHSDYMALSTGYFFKI